MARGPDPEGRPTIRARADRQVSAFVDRRVNRNLLGNSGPDQASLAPPERTAPSREDPAIMQRHVLAALALSFAVACQSSTSSSTNSTTTTATKPAPTWSYKGSTGPAHWGEMKTEYALAKTGKRQSPIDIVPAKAVETTSTKIVPAYVDTGLEILNNGHTVEDSIQGGGTLAVDGKTYSLAQFHFHSPSEHTIDGKHAPMEMHLVHKDAAGKLAVVAVMIQEGDENAELARLWKHMPKEPGRTNNVKGETVNASKLLPTNLASWSYSGSLTTPPCSEDVAWFVLETPIHASKAQVKAFRDVIKDNNRPTQPLNGRTVTAVHQQ